MEREAERQPAHVVRLCHSVRVELCTDAAEDVLGLGSAPAAQGLRQTGSLQGPLPTGFLILWFLGRHFCCLHRLLCLVRPMLSVQGGGGASWSLAGSTVHYG